MLCQLGSGVTDVPRAVNLMINMCMISGGWTSNVGAVLLMFMHNGKVCGLVSLPVEDLMFAREQYIVVLYIKAI